MYYTVYTIQQLYTINYNMSILHNLFKVQLKKRQTQSEVTYFRRSTRQHLLVYIHHIPSQMSIICKSKINNEIHCKVYTVYLYFIDLIIGKFAFILNTSELNIQIIRNVYKIWYTMHLCLCVYATEKTHAGEFT